MSARRSACTSEMTPSRMTASYPYGVGAASCPTRCEVGSVSEVSLWGRAIETGPPNAVA